MAHIDLPIDVMCSAKFILRYVEENDITALLRTMIFATVDSALQPPKNKKFKLSCKDDIRKLKRFEVPPLAQKVEAPTLGCC